MAMEESQAAAAEPRISFKALADQVQGVLETAAEQEEELKSCLKRFDEYVATAHTAMEAHKGADAIVCNSLRQAMDMLKADEKNAKTFVLAVLPKAVDLLQRKPKRFQLPQGRAAAMKLKRPTKAKWIVHVNNLRTNEVKTYENIKAFTSAFNISYHKYRRKLLDLPAGQGIQVQQQIAPFDRCAVTCSK